jgi:hypothetical protein
MMRNAIECIRLKDLFPFFALADTTEFAATFLNLMKVNMNDLETLSMPFFILIFNGMRAMDSFNFSLLMWMVSAISQMKNARKVLKRAAELLIQIRIFYLTDEVRRLTYGFLDGFSLQHRRFVLEDIESELLLVHFIALRSFTQLPYLSLLSLFFELIYNVFMKNDVKTVRTAARTLSPLASTIERCTDSFCYRP